MFYRMTFLTFLILSPCCSKAQVAAEEDTPAFLSYKKQLAVATQNTFNEVKRRFLAKATDQERNIIRPVLLRITDDWDDTEVFSRKDKTGSHITMSIGFIWAADYTDRAYEEALLMGRLDALGDYIEQLQPPLQRLMNAIEQRQPTPPTPQFCEWAGGEPSYCTNLRLSKANEYALTKLSSMALVLGHEFGHFVRDFGLDENSSSDFDAEKGADIYGTRVAMLSDTSPVLGFGTYLYFLSFVKDEQVTFAEGAAPDPACRALYGLDAGLRDLEPGFVSGHMDAVRISRSRLEKLKTSLAPCQLLPPKR